MKGDYRSHLSNHCYNSTAYNLLEKQRSNQQYRLLSKYTCECNKMASGKPPYKVITDDADRKHLLDSFDTFLFDCDGVLWECDKPIDGSIDAINFLLENQKQVSIERDTSCRIKTPIRQTWIIRVLDDANFIHFFCLGFAEL